MTIHIDNEFICTLLLCLRCMRNIRDMRNQRINIIKIELCTRYNLNIYFKRKSLVSDGITIEWYCFTNTLALFRY